MNGYEQNEPRRLAVILPGIGYTCDKPLLYYGGKLARSLGWEVLPVPYTGFPPKVRGDRERMKQSMEIALGQTEDMLQDVDWSRYDRVVFISKSIGTVVATAYADTHGIPSRHVLFTPVEATFIHPVQDAIAFHGTANPWADTAQIRSLWEAARIPLFITEGANHSLETGDVAVDIRNLETVMQQVKTYLQ